MAFYNGVMHVVMTEGLIDEEFVARPDDELRGPARAGAKYPPELAAPVCGIAAETIRDVARIWGRAKDMVIFWGMGISQHTTGTDNARCLIALCSITGNVGRPGTGLHPLRGQNNVQGASDAGLIPMMYPDYQRVEGDEANRQKFEARLGRRRSTRRPG